MYPMTPWVKRLLVANVVMYLVTQTVPGLYQALALVPMAVVGRPWTPITYMFLHAGIGHLFFNMVGLFFFGPRLEERLGSQDFLWLYVLGGIGGAIFSFFFAPMSAVVGASAAVYAILLGFAMIWPRERIYIWGVLPVEAWLLAAFLVLGSLWSGVSGARSGIAHFAHLGGLAFGFVYLKVRDWRRGIPRRQFQARIHETPSDGATSERSVLKRWKEIDVSTLHEINREEVESLLRKADAGGARSLTHEERTFLDRMSGRFN